MSTFVPSQSPNRPQAGGLSDAATVLWGLPMAVAIGCLLALLMTLGKALAVWRTGIFLDPDDAMRAVEVRDFLNGQSWFDLVQHRLAPAYPFPMHWSRLVDLPLAASMLLLNHVTDPQAAERITRLAEPALFYVIFLTALACLARDLMGRCGPLAIALLAAGALDTLSDFIPGHIHHHALQAMLLAWMVKLFCDGLDPVRCNRMAWAGAAGALSLAINLQNMPFLAAATALLSLMWATSRGALDRALGRFGVGLLAGAVVVFLLQVPPGHYADATCDAFAAPHLLAVAAGSLAFLALARISPRLNNVGLRLAILCVAGGLVLLLVKLTYPACLGDPYGGVDPLLRDQWMSEVGEAMPIGKLLVRDPWRTIPIVVAIGLGVLCALMAVRREAGLARARWIVIAVFGLVGVAGTVWQVRVAASTEVFASLGAAWWLCRTFATGAKPRRYGTLLCVLAGLGLTQAGWTSVLALPAAFGPAPSAGIGSLPPIDPEACFEPSSFEALRRLPAGLVLSTIDPGAHILAYTAHSALAAPYHRDAYGMRVALLSFGAPPEEARPLIQGAGARYLVFCTTSPEIHDFATRSPNGLAAQLLAGRVPAWLDSIASGDGPMRIYETAPALRP